MLALIDELVPEMDGFDFGILTLVRELLCCSDGSTRLVAVRIQPQRELLQPLSSDVFVAATKRSLKS